MLIVAGIGGTDEYRQRFHDWAADLRAALVDRHGLDSAQVTYLGERPHEHPGVVAKRSTRANILQHLGDLATRVGPGDQVVVVLIGHGTSQRDDSRFNLPGPDLTAEDLQAGLASFPTQGLALVHTGSASGGFVPTLSGPNRVIVTATRTARERNATTFPRFFVEAFAEDASDLDKNGRVSLLEAYQYARAEVARFFEVENQLLTEHAALDDDGDASGTHEPGSETSDGKLAGRFELGTYARGALAEALPETGDPVLARLYGERQALQDRVAALRARKDSLPAEEYDRALEAVLLDLALKTREIRARHGGGS